MATLVTGRMITDSSINTADIAIGAVGVSQLSAGAVAQSFGNTSGAFNFRNKIINGNFDIWQRGTSFSVTADNTYTADRWTTIYNGTGATRTISRQTFALGQTDVPNEPTYFLRWNQSVAGSNGTYNALVQRIESVKTFANKNITISFYAKAAAAMNIGVYAGQIFGTGESPSAAVYTNIIQATLSNTWQKYTVTFTVPSIAGKTLGSNNNDFLEIAFSLPLNTTFTFDVAQVQVEEGTAATPFEQRPIGMELSLCQRYYQKSYAQNVTPGTSNFDNGHPYGYGIANLILVSNTFPVAMRTQPAVTIYKPFGGNINQVENYAQGGARTVIGVERSENGIGLVATDVNVDSSGMQFHYTANAEL